MKVLAVGDIHQKPWILKRVESIIDNYDKVVFVGDYADDFSAKPQDRIEMWKDMRKFERKYSSINVLIGNHDYVYLHKSYAGRYTGWDSIAQALLDTEPNLKGWLLDLPFLVELDGVKYSHAGITDSWDFEALMSEDGPLWVRPRDGYVYKSNQVFGHTPQKTCVEVQKNVWCIDTFSTFRDGAPFGDHTVLEIIDGREFNKIKL